MTDKMYKEDEIDEDLEKPVRHDETTKELKDFRGLKRNAMVGKERRGDAEN